MYGHPAHANYKTNGANEPNTQDLTNCPTLKATRVAEVVQRNEHREKYSIWARVKLVFGVVKAS